MEMGNIAVVGYFGLDQRTLLSREAATTGMGLRYTQKNLSIQFGTSRIETVLAFSIFHAILGRYLTMTHIALTKTLIQLLLSK
jgi:hypothetical protein